MANRTGPNSANCWRLHHWARHLLGLAALALAITGLKLIPPTHSSPQAASPVSWMSQALGSGGK